MNNIVFSPEGWEDYRYWQRKEHIKTLCRISLLLDSIRREGPARGVGKPEPLRHQRGWSRRIDEKNRLVYEIVAGNIMIVSCRDHYDD